MGAKARVMLNRALGALAAAAGVVVVAWAPIPWWTKAIIYAVAAVVAVWVAFQRVPAFDPLGRIRWRLRGGGEKRCALTFDDGPTADTARVLDILKREGVPATFFVLADNVRRHPDLVRRAHAEGHAVGIHGMSHRKLTGAGEDEVAREVGGVPALLADLGVTAAPVYRTPHGHKSGAVFSVARKLGLTVWAWSRGVWDTDRPAPEVITRRSTRFARDGMVLLLHDGRGDEPEPDVRPMVTALPDIIAGLKKKRFAFVRLDS